MTPWGHHYEDDTFHPCPPNQGEDSVVGDTVLNESPSVGTGNTRGVWGAVGAQDHQESSLSKWASGKDLKEKEF